MEYFPNPIYFFYVHLKKIPLKMFETGWALQIKTWKLIERTLSREQWCWAELELLKMDLGELSDPAPQSWIICVWNKNIFKNQAPILNQQILKHCPHRVLLETGCCSTPRAGDERLGRPFNKNTQSDPLVGGSCLVKARKVLTQRCHTAVLLLRLLLNLLRSEAVRVFTALLADAVPRLHNSNHFVLFCFFTNCNTADYCLSLITWRWELQFVLFAGFYFGRCPL